MEVVFPGCEIVLLALEVVVAFPPLLEARVYDAVIVAFIVMVGDVSFVMTLVGLTDVTSGRVLNNVVVALRVVELVVVCEAVAVALIPVKVAVTLLLCAVGEGMLVLVDAVEVVVVVPATRSRPFVALLE